MIGKENRYNKVKIHNQIDVGKEIDLEINSVYVAVSSSECRA
jgi:hypothetical protein